MGAALGMGVGSIVISLIALMGLHTLLAAVPWLWMALKTAGGIYLIWMALKMFRGAHKPLTMEQSGAAGKSFRQLSCRH